ncbi:MAG: hypothetical protein AB8H86_01775 [Polyangiales bacterium]
MRSDLSLFLLAGCAVDHSGLIGNDAAPIDVVMTDVFTRPDSGPGPDSGVDAFAPDVGLSLPDAGNDAGFDAGNDAGFDAGDAGNDAGPVDPCSVGDDTDGDGVRDNCDECRGYNDANDANDADGDGTADGCDDWSCGPTRLSAPSVVEREEIQISAVTIGGSGNSAMVRPEDTFEITFDWTLGDAGCPGCIRQVEWGFTRIGRLGCEYDGNPPPSGVAGSAVISNIPIPPGSSGVYELRFALGQQRACADITNWHNGEPGLDHTIGHVCVPPAGIEYPGG